jgi:hypothetical protein
MPTSFKPAIQVKVYVKTPEEDLVFCSECGGINAMASTAVKIDCTACDTTGYENYWRTTHIPAFYRPGTLKRWDHQLGAIAMDGDASIKVHPQYESLMDTATHLEFNGAGWLFQRMRDPGRAMGQRRLVYAVTRKE